MYPTTKGPLMEFATIMAIARDIAIIAFVILAILGELNLT